MKQKSLHKHATSEQGRKVQVAKKELTRNQLNARKLDDSYANARNAIASVIKNSPGGNKLVADFEKVETLARQKLERIKDPEERTVLMNKQIHRQVAILEKHRKLILKAAEQNSSKMPRTRDIADILFQSKQEHLHVLMERSGGLIFQKESPPPPDDLGTTSQALKKPIVMDFMAPYDLATPIRQSTGLASSSAFAGRSFGNYIIDLSALFGGGAWGDGMLGMNVTIPSGYEKLLVTAQFRAMTHFFAVGSPIGGSTAGGRALIDVNVPGQSLQTADVGMGTVVAFPFSWGQSMGTESADYTVSGSFTVPDSGAQIVIRAGVDIHCAAGGAAGALANVSGFVTSIHIQVNPKE